MKWQIDRVSPGRLCVAAAALLGASVTTADAAEVVLQGPSVTSDATVSAWNDTTNYGAWPSYELRNDQATTSSWALVRFELPSLAAGEFIADAAMTFDYFANFDSTSGSMTVDLNRPLYSWEESGVSWRNRTSSWTWGGPIPGQENIDSDDGSGNNPVNYATTSLGQITLTTGQFGLKTFQSGRLTSTLNQMARGQLPNHGFLLNPGRDGGPSNRYYLVSSERQDLTLPSLKLDVATQKSFPVGWYDAVGYHTQDSPATMVGEGANVVIAYTGSATDIDQYLDEAAAAGLEVILQLQSYYIQNEDTTRIRDYVAEYDSHAALRGWYLADEPAGHGISVNNAEVAYQAVKMESTKPVFVAFARSELENGGAAAYANAYDTFLFDDYPFLAESSEFSDLDDWTSLVESAQTQAQQLGKSWWSIPQAIGQQPDVTFDKRLPTLNEARYQAYISVLHGAEGLASWVHYRAEQTLAKSDAPYPEEGAAWLGDVWRPLAVEFAEHGDALAAGALLAAVSDNRSDILCEVYEDPITGTYYLVAVNTSSTATQPTFTLSGLSSLNQAIYIGEAGADIDIINDAFYDTFTGYAVHVYKLVHAPEPASAAILAALAATALMRRRPGARARRPLDEARPHGA